jgi:hypothetical protein
VSRYAVRLTVAALVAVAVGLGVPAPASAAPCSTGHGVTVVVDFHQLGGGVGSACDARGAGKHASTQLADVGHTLTFAQRQPGFVCRVDGSPSSDPCINTSPADAYWSLWWSDGKSGTWSFSSEGVGSLSVPEGGYVGLSWQGGSGKAPPRVTPRAHQSPPPSPSPTPSPTHPSSPASPPSTATGPPTGGPTTASKPASSQVTGQVTRSASPLGHHQGGGHHSHGPTSSPSSPSATGNVDAARAPGPVEPSRSGPSGWVAPGLVALLFAAAVGVYVVRRRGSAGP